MLLAQQAHPVFRARKQLFSPDWCVIIQNGELMEKDWSLQQHMQLM